MRLVVLVSYVCLGLIVVPVAPSHVAAQTVPPEPTPAELVARLDVDPDMLHNDYTPAVWALCAHELEGAIAVLDALGSGDEMTRLHASRVLSCAVSRHFGWRPGQGYPAGSGGEERFRALWSANGEYAHDAPATVRAASIERWRAWLTEHRSDAPPLPHEPSGDAVRAALGPRLARARACLRVTTPIRVWAELTFVSRGDLSGVRVHGARGAAARCVERALDGVVVPPFEAPTHTLAVSIVGR
jgi:hypothetical protein